MRTVKTELTDKEQTVAARMRKAGLPISKIALAIHRSKEAVSAYLKSAPAMPSSKKPAPKTAAKPAVAKPKKAKPVAKPKARPAANAKTAAKPEPKTRQDPFEGEIVVSKVEIPKDSAIGCLLALILLSLLNGLPAHRK